jgi:L-aspartate oxidase
VQFHPTVCVESGDPFLVSEAVRGEGAVLRDATGKRFMPEYHEDAELAPRDVVARAVERAHEATGEVTVDVSPFDFETTFPDLAALCAEHGVDPSAGIPVVPAEHFLCGGIDVDTRGRASLDRLYAVGECARTGVHGANRLASTSLLEGLVWGLRAGRHAVGRSSLQGEASAPRDASAPPPDDTLRPLFERVQAVMDEHVHLRRTREGLRAACDELEALRDEVEATIGSPPARPGAELRSAVTVALLVARAARDNDTSVGCHYRVDADAPAAAASP